MFTWSVNSEITKVTGTIRPCHSPSQKPASEPDETSGLGPAAHDARTSAAPSNSTAGTSRARTTATTSAGSQSRYAAADPEPKVPPGEVARQASLTPRAE